MPEPAGPAPRRLAVLTGPTGVGKTGLAVEVAERMGTEILSADSMAVYRRMEAGTAKPTAEQRARVRHHLVDVADPAEPFTVADYLEAAVPVIERLLGEGRVPLVVGGTRLYLAALTMPFAAGPAPSPAFRARLEGRAAPELHAELAALDPEAAARLHPADRKRIVRALEVRAIAGRSIAEVQGESRRRGGRYQATWAALVRERAELYRRVDERVEEMLAAGLLEEVRRFREEGLVPETPSMQGHGYKELMRALAGEYSLEEGVRLLKRNTRRYVKYQLMWLRGIPGVRLLDAARPAEELVREAVRLFRGDSG